MKFGCCGNMITKTTGIEIIKKLEDYGYDYIELSLCHITQLSEANFLNLKDELTQSNLKCEVCHNFFPSNIKLTGLKVNWDEIEIYLKEALKRANMLGTKIIVFGSGEAKNVPAGYSLAKAWDQLIYSLRYISECIGKYEIDVVLEPLRKKECNIINSVSEALKLVKDVNRYNVNVLVDYYHMSYENESPEIIKVAKDYIQHIHFANSKGRIFPKDIYEDNYTPFIDSLKFIKYDKRVSIEAYADNFDKDCKKALQFLNKYFN